MARYFLFDASALAKRYVTEVGSPQINHLFANVQTPQLLCHILTTLEVISIFVRKKNRSDISVNAFAQAEVDFRKEVLDEPSFAKLPALDAQIYASISYIDKHAINSSDAIVLCATLTFQKQLAKDDSVAMVASDQRLLKAAQAEGLVTFNPESQTQSELDALLAS